MMRIGIDATGWANERGYGRFTRELVRAMVPLEPADEFVCFLDERAAARFSPPGGDARTVIVRQSVPPTLAAASGSRRSPMDMLRLTRAVTRARLDVFFSPSVYGFFPLPPRLPALVTVPDATPQRFPLLTLPTRRDRLFWRMKVRLALHQARLVLTVSDYAATQIVQHLRVPRTRIRVALEGVASEYRPSDSDDEIRAAAARAGLQDGMRWLLYVGGFGPHKHVDQLVCAHAQLVTRHPRPPLALLLVGAQDDVFHQHVPRIRDTIRAQGTGTLVRWLGYVPGQKLRHLHSGAVALVLPSASEGFGLPAVEAARCGAPVVATTDSPLPQLLEGGGLFVPPGDVHALATAIEDLLTDESRRRAMGRRAMERARALSWQRCARETLDVLQEVAKTP